MRELKKRQIWKVGKTSQMVRKKGNHEVGKKMREKLTCGKRPRKSRIPLTARDGTVLEKK